MRMGPTRHGAGMQGHPGSDPAAGIIMAAAVCVVLVPFTSCTWPPLLGGWHGWTSLRKSRPCLPSSMPDTVASCSSTASKCRTRCQPAIWRVSYPLCRAAVACRAQLAWSPPPSLLLPVADAAAAGQLCQRGLSRHQLLRRIVARAAVGGVRRGRYGPPARRPQVGVGRREVGRLRMAALDTVACPQLARSLPATQPKCSFKLQYWPAVFTRLWQPCPPPPGLLHVLTPPPRPHRPLPGELCPARTANFRRPLCSHGNPYRPFALWPCCSATSTAPPSLCCCHRCAAGRVGGWGARVGGRRSCSACKRATPGRPST